MGLTTIQPALLLPPVFLIFGLTSLQSRAQEAEDFTHKLTLGGYYSTGDYGASQDTEILYFPLSYELSRFPWILTLTVPHLSLDGPGDVFLEAGNVGRPRPDGNPLISESGLGDVILSGTYQFESLFDDFAFLDLTLQAKLPTADESRDLGTGELDVSLQVDLYRNFGDTTVFTTLGYRHRGRTPLYDLQDSAYFSLGAMHPLGENRSLGLLYDFREAASSSAYESHELMPFISWTPDDRWNLMLYTIFGFTSSSADRAAGFQLSYTWD